MKKSKRSKSARKKKNLRSRFEDSYVQEMNGWADKALLGAFLTAANERLAFLQDVPGQFYANPAIQKRTAEQVQKLVPILEKITGDIRYRELVSTMTQLIAARFGSDPNNGPRRSRLTVNVKEKTLELDGTVYGGMDEFPLLILDELIKARGNWMTRADLKKAQPRLNAEARLDLLIKAFKEKHPELGKHIEATSRGYRLAPSLFS